MEASQKKSRLGTAKNVAAVAITGLFITQAVCDVSERVNTYVNGENKEDEKGPAVDIQNRAELIKSKVIALQNKSGEQCLGTLLSRDTFYTVDSCFEEAENGSGLHSVNGKIVSAGKQMMEIYEGGIAYVVIPGSRFNYSRFSEEVKPESLCPIDESYFVLTGEDFDPKKRVSVVGYENGKCLVDLDKAAFVKGAVVFNENSVLGLLTGERVNGNYIVGQPTGKYRSFQPTESPKTEKVSKRRVIRNQNFGRKFRVDKQEETVITKQKRNRDALQACLVLMSKFMPIFSDRLEHCRRKGY